MEPNASVTEWTLRFCLYYIEWLQSEHFQQRMNSKVFTLKIDILKNKSLPAIPAKIKFGQEQKISPASSEAQPGSAVNMNFLKAKVLWMQLIWEGISITQLHFQSVNVSLLDSHLNITARYGMECFWNEEFVLTKEK